MCIFTTKKKNWKGNNNMGFPFNSYSNIMYEKHIIILYKILIIKRDNN